MSSTYLQTLLNGELLKAVNDIMEARMGYFWYVMIVLAPIVMVYIKTESVTFTSALLFWSIALMGNLIAPDLITPTLFTVFLLLGFGVLLFKVLSPAR